MTRETESHDLVGPSTSIQATAKVPLNTAWERFVPIELPIVFPMAKGPIPPVVAVESQSGRWDVPGRSRTVVLGDGSRVYEAITLSDPTNGEAPANGIAQFGYTVSGFSGPLSLLTSEARGMWVFSEVNGQTEINWTYAFKPTTIIARPMLGLLIATFWRSYMRDGLANTVVQLETD